jgi:hypothetical protein
LSVTVSPLTPLDLPEHEWVHVIVDTNKKAPLFHADYVPADQLAFRLIKGLKHCDSVTWSISGDLSGICSLGLNEFSKGNM